MAFTPVSGKSGSVLVGGTAYAFGKWEYAMKTGTPKVTNFNGSGYRQLVSGITEGTITVDGPMDLGNMALTSGNTYVMTLQWTNSVTLTGTGILASLTPSDDVEDAGRVKCTFEINGTFTAAIA